MTVIPQIRRVLKQLRIDTVYTQKAIVLNWAHCNIKSQCETHFPNKLADDLRSSYKRASSCFSAQLATESLDEYSDALIHN